MSNLVITYCGCVQLLRSTLFVIDGDKMPGVSPFIGWVSFDGTKYPVNLEFEDIDAVYDYLNNTFVNLYNLNGQFINSGKMEYTNPEDFQTAEIMIQYGLKHLVCAIGAPDPTTSKEGGFDLSFPNGTTFSSEEFFDMTEVEVRISNITNEQVEGITGHTYIPDDEFNPGMGTFSFPNAYQDTIMYITLSQKPA